MSEFSAADVVVSAKADNDVPVVPSPPFDPAIHLLSPTPNATQEAKILEMKEKLSHLELYQKYQDWANDQTIQRFLIARNYDIEEAYKLFVIALEWREVRKPSEIDRQPDWEAFLSKESESGKIYVAGYDQWSRPVLIFNNTVQNTPHIEDHMTFLAWNLEFATKIMSPKIDKYCVFINLEDFSFFNIPPFSESRETLHMLCNCFPERLGHLIAYKPPFVFKAFYQSVKMFLDAKTISKVTFIYGDVADGSENDKKMREIIGEDWKVLTGAEQPRLGPKISPGYDHAQRWPWVMQKYTEFGIPTGPHPAPEEAEEVEKAVEEEVAKITIETEANPPTTTTTTKT